MTKKTDQDALMIRFLLGAATEDEQSRLEEQFFADDELYQQMKAVEDELRYEYAQGGLTAQQRKSFESRYLVSDDDRQRVELAKAVLDKAFEVRKETAALAPAPEPTASWWQALAAVLTPQRMVFASSALALIFVSGGSWMMLQTMQLRDQVQQLQAQRKQVELQAQQQIAAERQQREQLGQELKQERALRTSEAPLKKPAGFFSFVLMPGLVRDADGPKRLVIPPLADEVALQLEAKAKFPKYRAELQNLDGDVIWSSIVPTANLTIPGRLLIPGDYLVVLKGITVGGEAVDAGEFYFQSVKR